MLDTWTDRKDNSTKMKHLELTNNNAHNYAHAVP